MTVYDFKSSMSVGDLNEEFCHRIFDKLYDCEIVPNNEREKLSEYDAVLKIRNVERTLEYKYDKASRQYNNFFIELFMFSRWKIKEGCFIHTKADYFVHSNINNIWVRETNKMKDYLQKHPDTKFLYSWLRKNGSHIRSLLGECILKKTRASNVVRDHFGDEVARRIKIVPNRNEHGEQYCAIGFVENVDAFNKKCGFKYHWSSENQPSIKPIIKEYLDKERIMIKK